jgi:hypothetical protein
MVKADGAYAVVSDADTEAQYFGQVALGGWG